MNRFVIDITSSTRGRVAGAIRRRKRRRRKIGRTNPFSRASVGRRAACAKMKANLGNGFASDMPPAASAVDMPHQRGQVEPLDDPFVIGCPHHLPLSEQKRALCGKHAARNGILISPRRDRCYSAGNSLAVGRRRFVVPALPFSPERSRATKNPRHRNCHRDRADRDLADLRRACR